VNSGPLTLGLDLGAGSAKAVVFDPGRGALAHGSGYHEVSIPRPGWAQQDPLDWWASCRTAVRAALNALPAGSGQVTALAVSGLGAAVVLIGRDGAPLADAMTGLDGRAGQEAADLQASDAGKQIRRHTGAEPAAWNTAAKLAWLRLHRETVLRDAVLITSASGFLLHRLTGQPVISVSDAGISDLFDLGSRQWAGPTLEALGLDAGRLPRILDSRAEAGCLTPAAAAELGLPAECRVIAGGEDTSSAALAAGTLAAGDGFVSLGTSAVAGMCRPAGQAGEPRQLTFPHVVDDLDLVAGSMSSAGAAVKWLAAICGTTPEVLLAEAEGSPPGANGVDFLPYLAGELHPVNDPDARGIFGGLSLANGRADLARSVIEGSAAAIAHNLRIAGRTAPPRQLSLTGTPARSAAWCQSIADAVDVPVEVVTDQGAQLGDAMLACAEPDLHSLVLRHRKVRARYEPRQEHADAWAARRQRLDALYRASRPSLPTRAPLSGATR
jgi:xylulokinase